MKKIVSFDYDDTLTKEDIAEYARELLKKGVEVWITTYRYSPEYSFARGVIDTLNNNIFKGVEELGISLDKIIFTNRQSKSNYLPIDCIWHLDDFEDCIKAINDAPDIKCEGVWLTEDNNWKSKCEELLWQ
jgi:hypothetical protein